MINNKKNLKKNLIILIVFLLLIGILLMIYFTTTKRSETFYNELYNYLKENGYKDINIKDEFLKKNNLYDDNFVCDNISYKDGVLEFVDCNIEDEKKSYCLFEGDSLKCFDKDNKPDLEVGFIDNNLNEEEYINEDVLLTANITEKSDLEIDNVLYCNTADDICVPNLESSDNSFNLNIESETAKVCIQVMYNNDTKSEIICSESYKIDKTVPTIDYKIKGNKGDNGWYISDVEITDLRVNDSLSGLKNYSINKSIINYETVGENIIISAEDIAGNKVEEVVNIKIDKSAPIAAEFNIDGVLGLNNWYKSSVNINTTGGYDNISGIKSTVLSDKVIDYDTSSKTIKLVTTDNAGNSSVKTTKLKVDKTAPIINYKIDGEKGNNNWYTSNVTIKDYNAVDKLSNIKGFDINKTVINYETTGENIVITAEDNAGNISQETINIKIDKTAPVITYDIDGIIGNNGWYVSNVKIDNYNTKDNLSGVASSNISNKLINYDTKSETIMLNAEDMAGNRTKESFTIKVDKTAPTVGQFVIKEPDGENGWYVSDVIINKVDGTDNLSGHALTKLNYDTITEDTSGINVILTTTDNAGNVSISEKIIKKDSEAPELTLKNNTTESIKEGSNIETNSYFNLPTYGVSGESSFSCNPINTSTLSVGIHQLECIATANNGLSKKVNKTVKVDMNTMNLADYVSDLEGKGEVVSENGLRYQGTNPNNYVSFNNELWRIIGVFDTKLADQTTTNKMVKIVKATPLEAINNNDYKIGRGEEDTFMFRSSSGLNNWDASNLKSILNDSYYNKTGSFSDHGLELVYKNLVVESTWNLGGMNNVNPQTALDFYNAERGTAVYGSNPATTVNNVGLIYGSDFMYGVKAEDCPRTTNGNNYASVATCHENNWLYILDDYTGVNRNEWTMTVFASHSYLIWNINYNGGINYNHGGHAHMIRPVVNLQKDTLINSGDGTIGKPFILN